jgi:proton glutamate symport protein
LRMTVIPLVVALLITGVGTVSNTAVSGRIAAQSMLVFAVALIASALLAALLAPVLLAAWPVAANAALALREGAQHAHGAIEALPPLRDWLIGIIPSNPFAAAAQGAMLPLVVFALLFGFAATRIEVESRKALMQFFQAIVDAMLVLVRGVLWVAPAGIFVLAMDVGQRGGIAAVGALGYYLALVCGIAFIVTVLAYPAAVIAGRVGLGRFAKAILPSQALAISTQSSLACLPVMIEAAQDELAVPRQVASIAMPFAVALFRITSPAVNLSIVLFAAHIYGVSIDSWHLGAGVAMAFLTNFAVVGLPSQITFFNTTVPISVAMGVPTEVLPLLLAIEVVPDLFRTVGNVTADLAATSIIARRSAA